MKIKPQMVFLLGLPRSGTKLLRDILNNHPLVSIDSLETQFIPKLYNEFRHISLAKRPNFHRMYEAFSNSVYALNVTNLGRSLLTEEEWYTSCSSFSLAEVFQNFYEITLLRERPSALIIGDKTPRYTGHVPLLMSLFPNSRFIHIVRDGRDRALSEQHVWKKSLRKSVSNWSRVLERLQGPLKEHPDKFLEVRYEDLIAEPEATLHRVVDFLKVPWRDGLTQLKKTAEHYGNARGALTVVSTNEGKYRKLLQDKQIHRLEQIGHSMFSHYDYAIDYAYTEKKLNWLEGKFLAVHDKVQLCLFHIHDKGGWGGVRYFVRMSL